MLSDPNLVEQIVAAVERRLETDLSGPAGPAETAESSANQIVCRELIVTGELLTGRITPEARLLRIAAGTILTPTALELVEQNELTVRVDANVSAAGDPQQSPAGWRLLLADLDMPVLTGYVSERCEGIEEAVSRSHGWLSGVASAGVVVLSTDPHRLVCLANRRSEVRAAVVSDVDEVSRVLDRLGANLVAACPLAAGTWMSRQIVETCLTSSPPEPPIDWPDEKS
jgi:hypothetical protein